MRLRRQKQDLFANLPSEIIIDILSRLPPRTIFSCKCVCKSWLNLIQTPEFVDSQFLNKVVSLTLLDSTPKLYTSCEIEEGLDPANYELKCSPLIKFKLPFQSGWVVGSVNGFILQCHHGFKPDPPLTLCVCNPITRDCIEFHHPPELLSTCPRLVALGFGATKITGQHKVLALFEKSEDQYYCYVYTIESRVWREIEPPVADNLHGCRAAGVFLSGNLYWLVWNFTASRPWIFCFDVENEIFTSFSSPVMVGNNTLSVGLCALGDGLCLCDNRSNGIDIWLFNEQETSWTKQFVIRNNTTGFLHQPFDVIYPFKVFREGRILMAWKHTNLLFYYFKKNKMALRTDMLEFHADEIPFLHAPSFRSLRSLGRDDVRLF